MALNVLYHDNHLLCVGKPAGTPTVPDDSGDESLLERSKAWVKVEYQKPGAVFLGVVHRLDRPVSGVVLFARTSKAAARMTNAFRDREVRKTYWGLCVGWPEPESGTVEGWLRKDRSRNVVRAHAREVEGSKRARTTYRTLERVAVAGERRARIELVPETGRSHQLRVALASLGTPLLGDLKYGAEVPLSDRSIALHAHRLEFDHPTTREAVAIACAPPDRAWWRRT